MSLVNNINGDNMTFGDIAESIFMIAIQSGNASSRIGIVFYVYKDNSIKTAEREGSWKATGLAHGNRRYNNGGDCWEVQQEKLPLSNFFAKHGEMIHTLRSLAAKLLFITCAKTMFQKYIKMAPMSLMNL